MCLQCLKCLKCLMLNRTQQCSCSIPSLARWVLSPRGIEQRLWQWTNLLGCCNRCLFVGVGSFRAEPTELLLLWNLFDERLPTTYSLERCLWANRNDPQGKNYPRNTTLEQTMRLRPVGRPVFQWTKGKRGWCPKLLLCANVWDRVEDDRGTFEGARWHGCREEWPRNSCEETQHFVFQQLHRWRWRWRCEGEISRRSIFTQKMKLEKWTGHEALLGVLLSLRYTPKHNTRTW